MSARTAISMIVTLLVGGLFWLGLTGAAVHAAGPEPYSKWFKFTANVSTEWDVKGDADPNQLFISSKQKHGPARRVLVLYPRASSAYDIAITQILQVFAAKDVNAELSVVNFELNDGRGKNILRKAEADKVDLIFAMGSESAAWLYRNYKGGALPVVTVCSKDPVLLGQMKDYDTGSGSNFAFTSLNVPIEVQMAYVTELRPNLKNIAILVDSKNISAVQTQADPIAKFATKKGVHVIWGSVQNPAKAREELEKIVPDAVKQMQSNDPDLRESLFWITGSTSVFAEMRTINQYSGRVPVISAVPEIVKAGPDTAVLGVGVSFESNGRLAGIYGAQVLAGAKVGTLKVGLVSPPDMAVSFLKAREIGFRVPFSIFEIASFVYDYDGKPARSVKSNSEPTN
ncbi:MAG: ABC transporter substrate-binding protein [Candidatus Binatia bacterium]